MRARKDALPPVRLHRATSLPIPWASRGIGSHPPDLLVGAQGVFAQAARSGHWLNGEGGFWCSSRHLIWHVPSRKDARALSHQEVFKMKERTRRVPMIVSSDVLCASCRLIKPPMAPPSAASRPLTAPPTRRGLARTGRPRAGLAAAPDESAAPPESAHVAFHP